MLALTRKIDQAIIINNNIEIRILEAEDGKVRLGITAPKDIAIYREEVYIEIEKSNKEALATHQELFKNISQILKK